MGLDTAAAAAEKATKAEVSKWFTFHWNEKHKIMALMENRQAKPAGNIKQVYVGKRFGNLVFIPRLKEKF